MLIDKQFFIRNKFTLEVEVTPYCNYKCNFCENSNINTFNFYREFNINFDFLINFILSINKEKITIILNGGEPTIHPNLLYFCQKIKKYNNIDVILYTNLSASESLYSELLKIGIKIFATFHYNNISFEKFIKKMKSLNIDFCILPCEENYFNFFYRFKDNNIKVKLILIENKKYSNDEIFKLIKCDKDIINLFFISKKINKKDKLCLSHIYYIYINGDGNIYKCMFNSKNLLGNIYNSKFNDINFNLVYYCNNSYCFYNFND